MTNFNRIGGCAALTQAASYITGFVLFGLVLDGDGYEGAPGALAFALDHAAPMALAMIVLYIVFGIAQVALAITLHRHFASAAPEAAQATTAFGLIWSGLVLASGMIGLTGLQAMAELNLTEPDRAVTAWVAIGTIQDGLGGGIELVGGVWIALASGLALRMRLFPRLLNWLGLVIGALGIATVVPGAGDLADIFGLAQIVWFAWIGFHLLRPGVGPVPGPVQKPLDREASDR